MKRKDYFKVGFTNGHIQKIVWGINQEKEMKIIRPSCSCKHGTMFPDNWKKREKICWHLSSAITILRKRVNGKRNKQENTQSA